MSPHLALDKTTEEEKALSGLFGKLKAPVESGSLLLLELSRAERKGQYALKYQLSLKREAFQFSDG